MVDHLIYGHRISPIGISYHLQKIWLNEVEEITWEKSENS